MPKFETSPILKGTITSRDLLSTQGTFHFFTKKESLANSSNLFYIIDNKFIFSLNIQNYSLIFRRNDIVSILTLNEMPSREYLGIWVTWNYTELTLMCTFGEESSTDIKKATVTTTACIPPNSLLKWARRNNLLPLEEYNTEEEFRNKVHSCLQSIQDKINESGSYSQFWNLIYKGGKIINRTPKKEIEVQPIIHSMLSDQLLMSSIEIIPEFKGSVGNLDFLFIAKVKNEGFVYFCTEFKNAHSDKLVHGLQTQLPIYMENKKALYGAYCVLDYRGKYFDKPKLDDTNIEYFLGLKRLENNQPYIDNIRVFTFTLSKPISASKRKNYAQQKI